MRLFELGLREFHIMDSLWCLLVSVSTVGYGDITPKTDGGRVVLVINQMLGTLVLSTLVAVIQSKLSFSNRCLLQLQSQALCSHACLQRKSPSDQRGPSQGIPVICSLVVDSRCDILFCKVQIRHYQRICSGHHPILPVPQAGHVAENLVRKNNSRKKSSWTQHLASEHVGPQRHKNQI
jgi:hypothetical protein